jgi:hypothetical protein
MRKPRTPPLLPGIGRAGCDAAGHTRLCSLLAPLSGPRVVPRGFAFGLQTAGVLRHAAPLTGCGAGPKAPGRPEALERDFGWCPRRIPEDVSLLPGVVPPHAEAIGQPLPSRGSVPDRSPSRLPSRYSGSLGTRKCRTPTAIG